MQAQPPEPMTIRCACGWEVTGTEDEVIAATIEHGRRLHNMMPSRDEVLAMRAVGTADVAEPT